MFSTVTTPARMLALREQPRTVGRLRFAIVPDERRLRLVGSDLRGAVEVRQHLDSPYAVRGIVIVHRLRPDLDVPPCNVVDGPCDSDVSSLTFASTFAAPIYDDDLDAVIAAVIRLHDRAVLPT